MITVMRLLRRFWKYIRPVKGWRSRVSAFRGGRTAWPVPGYESLGVIGPWPTEWTLYRVNVSADGKLAVEFLDGVSDVSGRQAKGEDAVRCARCGITLHVEETSMLNNLEVPSCVWCREAVG